MGDGRRPVVARAQIWLVACAFPPVSRGNSITNGCIAQELAREFDVTVIAIDEARGLLLSYDVDQSLLSDGVRGLRVRRFQGPNWLGLNEILYGIGLLPCYYLNWALKVWRGRATIGGEPAAVIGIYPVLSDLILAWWLSRALEIPLVVDFRDDLAGVMSRGWRRVYRPFYRWLEQRLLQRAALVTVTTEDLARDLSARHGVALSHFRVLHNMVPGMATGSRRAGRKAEDGLFRVVYAGAMSPVQRPEVLPMAYLRLLGRRPDLRGRIRVDICGPENRYFHRRVEPHGAEGVCFHGFRERAEVAELMTRADLGYLCLSGDTFAYATPTKLFDYIEFELPILGSLPRGAARRLVEERGLGVVSDPGDVDGVAAGLERLCDDAEFRQRCRAGLARVRKSFSVEAQGAAWRRVVAEVVGEGPALGRGSAGPASGEGLGLGSRRRDGDGPCLPPCHEPVPSDETRSR